MKLLMKLIQKVKLNMLLKQSVDFQKKQKIKGAKIIQITT